MLERRDTLGEEAFADELATVVHLPATWPTVGRIVGDFSDAPQHDDMAILSLRLQPEALAAAARPSEARSGAVLRATLFAAPVTAYDAQANHTRA